MPGAQPHMSGINPALQKALSGHRTKRTNYPIADEPPVAPPAPVSSAQVSYGVEPGPANCRRQDSDSADFPQSW